jgi:hypothetical protein
MRAVMKGGHVNQRAKPAAPKLVKFKTDYSAKTIEPVDVTRETSACVYLPSSFRSAGERREAKVSDYAQYHNSWGDAHAYLLQKAAEKVAEARRSLELANAKLGNIKGMKPPKEIE